MTLSDCHAQKHDVSMNACPSILVPPLVGMFYGVEDQEEADERTEEEIFLEELFGVTYQNDPFSPIDERRQAQIIRKRVSNFLAEEEYLEELEAARSAVENPLDDDEEDEEELDEDEILIQERNQHDIAWLREGLELAEEAPIPLSAYAETRALVTHQYIEFLRLNGQKEEA